MPYMEPLLRCPGQAPGVVRPENLMRKEDGPGARQMGQLSL